MRIDRLSVRITDEDSPLCEVDSGDRPLGDIVFIRGGDDAALQRVERALEQFLRSALLQLVEKSRYPTSSTQDSSAEALAEAATPLQSTAEFPSAEVTGGELFCRTESGRPFEVTRSGRAWALSNGAGLLGPRDLGLGEPLPPADAILEDGPAIPQWSEYRQQLSTSDSEVEPESAAAAAAIEDESAHVEGQIDVLRSSLQQADEMDERRARLDNALSELHGQRLQTAELRRSARHKLRRIAELRPVQYHLQQLERWREQAGNPEELCRLPEDPGAALEELSVRLNALGRHLSTREAALADLRPVLAADDAWTAEVLAREEEVEALQRTATGLPLLQARVDELQRHRDAVVAGRDRRASELVDETHSCRDDEDAAILAVDCALLKRTLADLPPRRVLREAKREELDLHQQRRPAPAEPFRHAWGAGIVAGGALLTWLSLSMPLLAGAVVTATVAGLAVLVALHCARRAENARCCDAHLSNAVALDAELRQLNKEIATRKHTVAEIVAPLAVHAEVLASPQPELAVKLEEVQREIYNADRISEELSAVEAHVARDRRAVEALASELTGWEAGAELRAEQALASAVFEARERRARAEQARHEADRLRSEITDLRRRQANVSEERRDLQHRLKKLAPAADNACRIIRERYRAWRAAEWLEAHLRRDVADLESLRAELALAASRGEEWLTDEDAVTNLTTLTESLDDEMVDLDRGIAEARCELEVLRERPDAAPARARVQKLEQQLQGLEQRRQELLRISRLLLEADREFVAEHQPTIVATANEYLWRIAGCEPQRLHSFVDDGSGALRLDRARGPVDRDLLPVARMALRLALVAELGDRSEPLPLLVADPAALGSPMQARRALAVLREVSQRRQVFVFCSSVSVDSADSQPAVDSHPARRFRADRKVRVGAKSQLHRGAGTADRATESLDRSEGLGTSESWYPAWRERLQTLRGVLDQCVDAARRPAAECDVSSNDDASTRPAKHAAAAEGRTAGEKLAPAVEVIGKVAARLRELSRHRADADGGLSFEELDGSVGGSSPDARLQRGATARPPYWRTSRQIHTGRGPRTPRPPA